MYSYSMYKKIELGKYNYIDIGLNTNINISYSSNDDFKISTKNNKYVDLQILDVHEKEFELAINNENDYSIEFEGIEYGTLNIVLYIYTYKKDKQIYKEVIKLNTIKQLEHILEGEYIKILIRVYGNGEGKIKTLNIKSKKNIRYITSEEIYNLVNNNPKSIKDLKVACILDSFTMKCYEDMCELIKITPNTWKIDLEINKPDLLLVESAWYGNNNEWEKKIQCKREHDRQSLKDVIEWCNENKVPTVFWNKEDPFHYNHFIKSAKLFDYIFTTDENCIKKYKKDSNNENVYVLQFAAQPKIHNPIKVYEKRIDKACFAGSFYNNKYVERKESLENLLRVAKDTIGLDIYDRNYNNPSVQYKFPKEFDKYIKGYLESNELDKCNKGYKVMLNTNSIIDSPTMFSRRVFEGLACGTPIISSYSLGIKTLFNGLVVSSDSIDDLKEEILKLKQESYYDNKVVLGVREILRYHTYQHRISFILEKIGMKLVDKKNKLCVLCKIKNIAELNKIKSMYESQTYKNKELYILVEDKNIYDLIRNNEDSIKILLVNEINKKININRTIISDYVGVMNSNNYYSNYYFEDMINATLYTDAEFIGKKSFFRLKEKTNDKKIEIFLVNKNQDYQYVEKLDLDKCIFKHNIIKNETIETLLNFIEKNSIEKIKFGARYLSIDKYNFIEGISYIQKNDYIDIEV